MRIRWMRLLMCSCVSFAAIGCSSHSAAPERKDDDDDDTQVVRGGTPQAAGRSASPDLGVAGAPAPVQCGNTTCPAPAGAFAAFAAFAGPCCEETTQTCGMSVAGSACTVPPESDPRCAPLDLGGFISLPSCCASDGQCGIDAAMFGSPGCLSLAEAAQMAMSFGVGGFIALPEPQRCGDPTDADAGM